MYIQGDIARERKFDQDNIGQKDVEQKPLAIEMDFRDPNDIDSNDQVEDGAFDRASDDDTSRKNIFGDHEKTCNDDENQKFLKTGNISKMI